jgi:hypothetical protein
MMILPVCLLFKQGSGRQWLCIAAPSTPSADAMVGTTRRE